MCEPIDRHTRETSLEFLPQTIEHRTDSYLESNWVPENIMAGKQDRIMATTGILSGVMLLNILLGDTLSIFVKTLVFGIAIQSLFGFFVQAGLSQSDSARPYRVIIGFCSLISVLLLIGVIILDHQFHQSTFLLFGMEPATTLFVFGITLWPFTFVFLWAFGFNKAILPPETIKKLERIGRSS
jgi:hypothetical protein